MLTPKDREGSVEPQWVRTHQTVRIRPHASDRQNQTRLTLARMDNQILTRYAKGRSPRDIVEAFQEMDDADVSGALISQVTDQVLAPMTPWQ